MNFPTTHWSVLAQATLDGDAAGREALGKLCRDYWRPVADFLQFRGLSGADAEDMTQEFFHALLLSRGWQRANRTRGKFRSFLLGALMRVLSRDRERRLTQKRGGGEMLESLEALSALDGFELPDEQADQATLRVFDHAWAQQVMEAALNELVAAWEREGKGGDLDVLLAFLPAGADPVPCEAAAARLGLTIGAVKLRILRLREQFRQRLEAQVARTVSAPHEIAEEMAHLHRVLADPGRPAVPCAETPGAESAEKRI